MTPEDDDASLDIPSVFLCHLVNFNSLVTIVADRCHIYISSLSRECIGSDYSHSFVPLFMPWLIANDSLIIRFRKGILLYILLYARGMLDFVKYC